MFAEPRWQQVAQRIVSTNLVVLLKPAFCDAADLARRVEHVGIERFKPNGDFPSRRYST